MRHGLVSKTTFFCPGCNASVCPKCQDSWKHHDTEQLDSRRKKVEVKVKVKKVKANLKDLEGWRR